MFERHCRFSLHCVRIACVYVFTKRTTSYYSNFNSQKSHLLIESLFRYNCSVVFSQTPNFLRDYVTLFIDVTKLNYFAILFLWIIWEMKNVFLNVKWTFASVNCVNILICTTLHPFSKVQLLHYSCTSLDCTVPPLFTKPPDLSAVGKNGLLFSHSRPFFHSTRMVPVKAGNGSAGAWWILL